MPRERPADTAGAVAAESPRGAGAAISSEDVAAAVPLPRARPGGEEVVAANEPAPPLPADKPEGTAEPAPLPNAKPAEAAPPVPEEKPAEAAAPVPEERPAEAAAPLPEVKPAETTSPPPVPDEKPAEAAAPLPEEKPEAGPPDSGETSETDAEKPKEPLFAEDAMSPACAAIEEGRVSGRPLKPIEDPMGCVVPAVYGVSSVGTERAVSLSIEAELTCAMVDRLDTFVEEVIEPAAKDILGSELTGLGIAGSYVCRTRNGVPDAEPSEHGKANAIDIASFSLADGRVISVTSDWPHKAVAEEEEAPEAGAEEADDPVEEEAAAAEEEASEPGEDTTASETEVTETEEESDAARFLLEVHSKACGPFTTVIGPDGDEYHQDHFHFDLQKRGANGQSTFCQ